MLEDYIADTEATRNASGQPGRGIPLHNVCIHQHTGDSVTNSII